ncbi:hypothetical protein HN873_065077 [Arachis hypogaea]
MSEEELDTFSTELLFAADMGPPQFQWRSVFQSLPLHHPVWTGDENHILAANVGGNQQLQPQLPPLPQFAANVLPPGGAAGAMEV